MSDTEKIRVVVEAEDNASGVLNNVKSGLSGLQGLTHDVDYALRQYNNTMSTFNNMVIQGVKEVGSAIYDFTSDSINNFSELSEQHAKTLGAMANDYDKTIEAQQRFIEHSERLKQQAIDLGKYGIGGQGSLSSPSDISALQTELVKAGVPAQSMLTTNIVSDVLQFAQANQLDNASAVEFAVSLGSQFGIGYEGWGDMLDKVSHTADMSIVDVKDIVQSMKYAGGISSGLDRPLEETLGMISILGNFGLKGSQAGSGIQALLTRLLTGDTTVITQAQAEVAPPKALQAFYDFSNFAKSDGSEITYDDILNETFTEKDITGQLRPMDEVLDTMETVMSELTDEEQAWFAKKLFGLYQMKSAYALINGDDSGDMALQDVITEITENSTGTNANKLAELLNSQSGQFSITMNMIEGIKTELGMMLEPTTIAILKEMQGFLKDPGNYDINWENIKTALDESCDDIEKAYGTAIADAVRGLGGLTIDLGQVVEEIAPSFVEGIAQVFGSMVDGDLIGEDGVSGDWGTMIENMKLSLEDLPPDLQELGEKTIGVIDMFGKLAALNTVTTIAQLLTSTMQLALMTINAGTVIVKGVGGAITHNGVGAGAGGSTLRSSTVVGSADDVASALGVTSNEVVSTFGQKSAYTIDDIASGLGTSSDDVIKAIGSNINGTKGIWGALSKTGKALGIAGTVLQVGMTGYETYQNLEDGNNKGAVEAVSGGIGSLAGGVGGAKLGGAIGTMIAPGVGTGIGIILGALAGSLAGDKLGRSLGGAGYDSITSDKRGASPSSYLTGPSNALNSISGAAARQAQLSNIPGVNAMSDKAIQNYLDNQIAITPQFTMEAPQVQVEITMDNSGNIISQKQSILNPGFNRNINNWYQRVASQNGSTTK